MHFTRRMWAMTLIASLAVAGQVCRAQPSATPRPGPAVKGFDAAVQPALVPGFGVPAPTGQVARSETAANLSATKESVETAAKDPKASPRLKSYRVLSPYERSSFPSGVPEWFKQRDSNFDGQVHMWEYASSWNDQTAQNFTRLDANGDGVITARESIGRRDVEVEPARRPSMVVRHPVATIPTVAMKESPREAVTETVPTLDSIPPAFVGYADGVIKRFDTDRDGVLSAEEWTAMPAPPATADADNNGQITVNELAVWYVRKR